MRKFKIIPIIFIVLLIAIYPFGESAPIKYVERSSDNILVEKVMGEYWLRWLYNNPVGKLSLETLVKKKLLSDWYGDKMDLPESVSKISGFIDEYNIDMSIFQNKEFSSFNDFFYRKLKANARIIDTNVNVVCSPADGKVLVYKDIMNQDFIVKGYKFNVKDFLQNDELAKKYKDGSLMIFRLCPTDYHRYHFPLSGNIQKEVTITGDYYSVSPIALKKKIELLCLNKRSYLVVKNEKFGDYIIADVGATMVGSIIHTFNKNIINKGEEMGYFKFGGSTIVLLFSKNAIVIDEDLIKNTSKGFETEVKFGERVAVRYK